MKFARFDTSLLTTFPLAERANLQAPPRVVCADLLPVPGPADSTIVAPEYRRLGALVAAARDAAAPVILFLGGAALKAGVGPLAGDLVRAGHVTHVALTGGALAHDYELALSGATSEHVLLGLACGNFGMWRETHHLLADAASAAACDCGLGEAVGATLAGQDEHGRPHAAHPEASIVLACYRAGIPCTVHTAIGADCWNAVAARPALYAALGYALGVDFLVFAESVRRADVRGGVFLLATSAVIGPEVLLKAVALSRNVQPDRRGADRHLPGLRTVAFYLRPPVPHDDGDRVGKNVLVRPTLGRDDRQLCLVGDIARTFPSAWRGITRSAPH